METLVQDIRYALISMRRSRAFSVAALITLALGIGATTAVFSVVYGVLLRPLPYPESDRLVQLSEEHPGATAPPIRQPMLSNLTYHAWAQAPKTVEQFAAYSYSEQTVALPGGPVRLVGAPVTPSLFPLLGATPALGRFFRPDEARTGADAVLVLTDRLFREHFGSDPAIVGRSVMVDAKPHTIVGVARPGFQFGSRPDTMLWTPLEVAQPSADAVAGQRGRMTVMWALARLRPGVTPQQAEAEGTAAARSTIRPMAANLLFGVGGPPVVHARGMVQQMTSRVRASLLVLAAGVVCVLLIACANVASLLLSRGVARQRELTVRAAIGASRGRLARQLLTESFVVCAFGGAAGVALAWTLVRLMPMLAARDFPRLDDITIDGRTITFAAITVVVTAIVTGMAPALRGTHFDLAEALHGGDGATAGGFRGARGSRTRTMLLVMEAAFASLLLVGAVLLARSFVRLLQVDPGYTADHVLVTEIFVPSGDAPDQGEPMRAFVGTLLDRARALPGVTAVGAGNMMPLDRMTQIAGFPAPWTRPGTTPTTARSIQYVVTPGYGEALGLRLKKGRLFRDSDLASDVRPWVVNEEFARLYLPPDPIGYQWKWPATATTPERTNEIVGVIANVLKFGNDAPVQPEHYSVPHAPNRFSGHVEIALRTATSPATLAPAMRALVRDAAPSAAAETMTLSDRVADSMNQPRFALTVLVTFALLALALASVGLYGVLSYGVSQRRRELGVRAALGAGRRALIVLVIREGLATTAAGLLIGLSAAAALTRLMQALLFGVTPLDVVSFTAAPLLLLPVALTASLVPAVRAARTDPADALRTD